MVQRKHWDVIVIGSGLAGLTASRLLRESGLDVLMIEARSVAGGRMFGGPATSRSNVDYGAQYVGETHYRLRALIERLDLRLHASAEAYNDQLSLQYFMDGDIRRMRGYFEFFSHGELPELGSKAVEDVVQLIGKLRSLLDRLPCDLDGFPTDHPDNRAMDQQSFLSWVQDHCTCDSTVDLMRHSCEVYCCVPPEDISLLHLAWILKIAPHGQNPNAYIVREGVWSIAKLLSLEETILFDQKVKCVQSRSSDVVVETCSGSIFQSSKLLVTVPPPAYQEISFSPPLPVERQCLAEKIGMGKVIKINIVYSQRFWLDDQLSGFGLGKTYTNLFVDSSDPDREEGKIVAFAAGSKHALLSTFDPTEQKRVILAELADYLGDQAWDCLYFHAENWVAAEGIGGGYHSYFKPGGFLDCARILSQPCDHIFWAGSDLVSSWPGYLEGAIASAEQAARQIKESLS